MDPNLYPPQQPTPQQPVQNPYDFLNSQPSQKKSLFSGGQKPKPLVLVLFVIVVLFIVVIVISAFSALTKTDYSAYQDLLVKQATIIHITDTGANKLRTVTVKNYSSTVASVTATEKLDTAAYLAKSKSGLSEKQLTTRIDTSNDKALTAAEQTNDYDGTYLEVLNKAIVDYQKAIQSTVGSASTKTQKVLVAKLQSDAIIIANIKTSK